MSALQAAENSYADALDAYLRSGSDTDRDALKVALRRLMRLEIRAWTRDVEIVG